MSTVFVPLLTLVACTSLVFGLVYLVMRMTREREAQREQLWRSFAEPRGGFSVPASGGFFRRRAASIVVPHAHASVSVDVHVVSHGKSSTTYTRARARYALGFGPSFRISSEGLLSAVGKALGAQDLVFDDLAFDARFVIKGESLDGIRAAWTPRARQAALSFERPSVSSDGNEVVALVLGVLVHDHELEALTTMVGEVASYRVAELADLARAAEATFQPPSGQPPMLRFATPRGDVTAGLARHGLVLRLVDARGLPPLAAVLSPTEVHGLPGELLTDAARALVPLVGSCRLATQDGFVWLTWPGVPDARSFRAGAELLAELAGGDPSRGAFR
jgi:hypothetical protein